MVVVCDSGLSEFKKAARAIADARDDSLLSELQPELDGDIIYVCSPQDLEERIVLRLQQRLLERGPTNGGFGIITGLTGNVAEEMYFAGKEDTTEGNHCMALKKTKRPTDHAASDPDTTILNQEEVTVEKVNELRSDGLASFSIMTNARSIHTMLRDGYICGAPETHAVDDFDGPHPPCVNDDGTIECPLDGELIPADSFAPDHMFFNSCMSMIPGNNITGLPVHAGLNLIEGSQSVIAAYAPKTGNRYEVALHQALLRAGYSAKERCYILNKHSHAVNEESYPYALFGEPTSSVSAPEQEYEVELENCPRGVEASISGIDGHVVEMTIASERLPGDTPLYVRNVGPDTDSELCYSVFDEGEQTRVLIYTWGELKPDELRVQVGLAVPRRQREIVKSSVENLQPLDRLNILGSKAQGQMDDLMNYYTKIPGRTRDAKYSVEQVEELRENYQTSHEKIQNICSQLLDSIPDKPRYPLVWYTQRSSLVDVGLSDIDCPNCGRPLSTKISEDTVSGYRRIYAPCPMCVVAYAVPLHDSDEEISVPLFTSDTTYDTNGVKSISLAFTNPTDKHMEATYFLYPVDDQGEFDDESIQRNRIKAEIEPGEQVTKEFEVDITEIDDGVYPIYGYVVGNLDIYHGAGSVTIQRESQPSALDSLHT